MWYSSIRIKVETRKCKGVVDICRKTTKRKKSYEELRSFADSLVQSKEWLKRRRHLRKSSPQLTAVRSAIHHVSVLETQDYVQNEIDKSIEQGGEQNEVYEAIEKLLDLNKNALFFAGDLIPAKTPDSEWVLTKHA